MIPNINVNNNVQRSYISIVIEIYLIRENINSNYITAAARGAPRHDQRKVVWGVYDETRSKHLPRLYVLYSSTCIRIQVG